MSYKFLKRTEVKIAIIAAMTKAIYYLSKLYNYFFGE